MKVYFLTMLICIVFAQDEAWLNKFLPRNLEFTNKNEVAIVYETKINFDGFWAHLRDFVQFSDIDTDLIKREIVREGLSTYLWPLIVISPVKPGNSLYDAEYEHKKEVWGHKAIKDFIITKKAKEFSKADMQTWFQETAVKGTMQP